MDTSVIVIPTAAPNATATTVAADPYGTWASLREIDDGGVLLVRPDLYIAARQLTGPSAPREAHQWLAGVLSSVLGRPVTASRSA